nr:YJU2 splicing factor homolog [Coffea arabica]
MVVNCSGSKRPQCSEATSDWMAKNGTAAVVSSTKIRNRILEKKIQKFRFYIKCNICSSENTFKTDPKNSDYVVDFGAKQYFEPWQTEEETEEMGGALKELEKKGKRELHADEEEKRKKLYEDDDEDEALIRSVFRGGGLRDQEAYGFVRR